MDTSTNDLTDQENKFSLSKISTQGAVDSTRAHLYFTIDAMSRLLLFEASRSQLVRETIRPALERGLCVIADRFFDSTTVYQGTARKLDPQFIERLNAFAVDDCVPDITFVLDVDAATAESRMQKPRRPDRMEQQSAEFHERVRRGYRDLAAREPNRMVLIEGSRHADVIENEIWQIILSRFAALSKTSNIEHQTSKI